MINVSIAIKILRLNGNYHDQAHYIACSYPYFFMNGMNQNILKNQMLQFMLLCKRILMLSKRK